MKELEYEKELMEKFPDLHSKDESGKVVAPSCGTSCPVGWQPLVTLLCKEIDSYIKCPRYQKNPETNELETSYPKPLTIVQIKEKFGGLRFYADGGDAVVCGMIRFAEAVSFTVCQNSGNPGSTKTIGGWLVTLSEEEYEKEKNRFQ